MYYVPHSYSVDPDLVPWIGQALFVDWETGAGTWSFFIQAAMIILCRAFQKSNA